MYWPGFPRPTSPSAIHYYRDTDVDTLTHATFTYIMCDFWVDASDDRSTDCRQDPSMTAFK